MILSFNLIYNNSGNKLKIHIIEPIDLLGLVVMSLVIHPIVYLF